jgi:hypothetical protein
LVDELNQELKKLNSADVRCSDETKTYWYNYNEDEEVLGQRFNLWLRDVVLSGVEMWRRGI